jgi:ring-1,2-phenylacetyl-CoA epoxidase subunit PaaB
MSNEHSEDKRQWPLYEVFVRARGGLDHKHVGSLHASMRAWPSIMHAICTRAARRGSAFGWWPSKQITASDPAETDSLFEPARDKIYRHPTFYEIPDEVKTLCADLFRYVLRLGDLSLVLGQRLGEWVGHSPALEEDLGLANVALDMIGQARLLLSYAGRSKAAAAARTRSPFCASMAST